ncbi:MAG: glycosyltransferase family A protein, partial [Candidatus Aenigmatarchaeota archaeon]
MPRKVKETKSACVLNLENGDILNRSVERLLKENTEVLIVDNNSHDCTSEVLKKYENNSQVKIWRWNTIKGQSYNRNLMIKNASGKYILLLDADILYIPKSFDYLIQRLKNAPPEIKCIGFDPWYYTNKEEEADTELPPLDTPLSF